MIHQVPADRLLIIEDASAKAFDAATAGDPGAPRIIGVFTMLSLRTNPNTVNFGTADYVIAAGRGLPLAGGRTLEAYAAPGTEIVYQIKGCAVPLNTRAWFAGRLIDPVRAEPGRRSGLRRPPGPGRRFPATTTALVTLESREPLADAGGWPRALP